MLDGPISRFSPITYPAFARLLLSEGISTAGDAVFTLAIMWITYASSHSIIDTALIQVVWQLPFIVLGPFAGVFVDRWDRKLTLVVGNLVAGVTVLLLTVAHSLIPNYTYLEAWISIVLLNTAVLTYSPARFSLLPRIVKPDELGSANGWLASVRNVASFFGTLASGWLIATAGAIGAFGSDALSFFVSGGIMALVPLAPIGRSRESAGAGTAREKFFPQFRQGWAVVAQDVLVRRLVMVSVALNVMSLLGPLVPALVHLRLHGGAIVYSILGGCEVVGAALAGVYAGRLTKQHATRLIIIVTLCVQGVALVGVAASTSVAVTATCEFLDAFAVTLSAVAITTTQQMAIPSDVLGRAQSIIRSLSSAVIPVSAMAGGFLAQIFGPAPLFAAAGGWALMIAVIVGARKGAPGS